jgi:hypothetical protein
MPKTGGTWVRHVLHPIAVEEYDHAYPDKPSANVFAFVRNPWAWHVSTYNSIVYGSDTTPADLADPVLLAHGSRPSFAEFVETQTNPSDAFKRKVLMALRINKASDSSIKIAELWIDSNLGWYQLMCNEFLRYATRIGRTETLHEDLKQMLLVANDMKPQVFARMSDPKINVSMEVDYRSMYSYDLAQQVNATCQPMISQFGYTF